jgi:hypothetical protein
MQTINALTLFKILLIMNMYLVLLIDEYIFV